MQADEPIMREGARLGSRLAGIYTRCLIWYFLGVLVLWLVGVEALYGHPTPFYGYFKPAFSSGYVPAMALSLMWLGYLVFRPRFFPHGTANSRWHRASFLLWLAWMGILGSALLYIATADKEIIADRLLPVWRELRWHLLALALFFAFLTTVLVVMRRLRWSTEQPSHRATVWLLVGLVVFAILFSSAIAMIRGGTHGISHAYERYRNEYIGDIGHGGSIRGLLANYVKLHPHLSMHARVHPPGPIILLWLLSYVAGREAMGLSVATIVVGSLGIVPLYLWARDLTNRHVALTSCLLYSLAPSIVLFTATSADILFTPFTLLAMYCFWRAVHRRSWGYGLAAGAIYAAMSLLSFSLLSIGAYFAFVALWRLREKATRTGVFQAAATMALAFLAVHLAVRWWSGFDVVACFKACKTQFDVDQTALDTLAPRYPSWIWKIFNPLCWVFFVGIPVSCLFGGRLARGEPRTRSLFWIFAVTLLALDILYLARGEGERSAMYIVPFVVLPAAHLLDRLGRVAKSYSPLAVTVAFLAFQCWLVETYFYMYW